MLKNLLDKAALRVTPLKVDGENILIREPSFFQMHEFHTANSKENNNREALAKLFAACVTDEDGTVLSVEDAYKIVDGKGAIFVAVLNAVTGPMAEGEAKNV